MKLNIIIYFLFVFSEPESKWQRFKNWSGGVAISIVDKFSSFPILSAAKEILKIPSKIGQIKVKSPGEVVVLQMLSNESAEYKPISFYTNKHQEIVYESVSSWMIYIKNILVNILREAMK